MKKIFSAFLGLGGFLLATSSVTTPAFAMPESCQKDFAKYGGQRQAVINRINGFNKKSTSASAACSAFTQLANVDANLIKWMTANQEWCQIPEETIAGIKGQTGQVTSTRNKACNAASQQAKQIAIMKKRAAQQQQAGGMDGGGAPTGVRLPKGAL